MPLETMTYQGELTEHLETVHPGYIPPEQP